MSTYDRSFLELVLRTAASVLARDGRALPIDRSSGAGGASRAGRAELEAAWATLDTLDDEGTLGTRVGLEVPLAGTIGWVAAALQSRGHVEPGLDGLARFYRLFASGDALSIERDEGEALLVLRPLFAPGRRSRFAAQLTLAMLLRGVRQVAGQAPLRWVWLAAPLSGTARQALAARLDAPVLDAQGFDALCFPAAFAHAPLAPPDAEAIAGLEAALQSALGDLEAPADVTVEVLREVQASLSTDASIERVAARLGTTPRTLQRRLREAGTSFRAIRTEGRVLLAKHYLRFGASVTETAFLTGYADATAFTRAHRRATGQAPSAERS